MNDMRMRGYMKKKGRADGDGEEELGREGRK